MRGEKGLTMIELLLVLALVSVVTAFSAIFYSRFLTQNAVLNTVDQITGQLHKAQLYAMMSKLNGNWGVDYGSQIITLYQGNSYAARNSAFDEKFTVNNNISVSGLADVNFMRVTGTPSASPTVTISGQNNIKTVTVNSFGMVSR